MHRLHSELYPDLCRQLAVPGCCPASSAPCPAPRLVRWDCSGPGPGAAQCCCLHLSLTSWRSGDQEAEDSQPNTQTGKC